MGQTLTNGIFLPNEGERNCYTGLAGNWRAIDGYIGDYNVHVADAVIHVSQADRDKWDAVDNKADASALTAHTGNTTIHVTAADKEAWNGKADASALTAHTGNTTIHVTAADKEAWNGKADASALTAHTGDTTIHVTAADKQTWDTVTNKANDADVMHLTGDETSAGIKTFSDATYVKSLNFTYNVPDPSSSSYSQFFITNTITYTSGDPSVTARVNFRVLANGTISIFPHENNLYSLGLQSRRFKGFYTYLINDTNPGALSLPNINNRVDISGYVTDLTGANNLFTPTANGWICIRSGNATKIFIGDSGTAIGNSVVAPTAQYLTLMYPCTAGRGVNISINCTSLAFALFIPSLGHI